MASRLHGVGIAFAICLISAPIAIVVTIALLPLWSWIEATFGIESIGHSGPAEWSYLACYLLVLSCFCLIWWTKQRKTDM